jgi:hypothetical protein
MKKEQIEQRAYEANKAWAFDYKDSRSPVEFITDFTMTLIDEAERAAFEAAREQEIVGEGYDQEIKFKYETIEDWRNHDPSRT